MSRFNLIEIFIRLLVRTPGQAYVYHTFIFFIHIPRHFFFFLEEIIPTYHHHLPPKKEKRYSETMSPHTLSQSQGTFFKDHFHPVHTGVGPLCHPNTPSSDCIIPLERLGCVFFVCA